MVMWIMAFVMLILKFFRNHPSIGNTAAILVLFGGLQLFFVLKNNCRAEEIKTGEPLIDISFTSNNNIVKTDSVFIYIGTTQNFIFLFDKKGKATSIYKRSNISQMTVKRIEYPSTKK